MLSCSARPGTTTLFPYTTLFRSSLLDSCQSLLALPSSRPLRTTRRPSLPARYSPDIRGRSTLPHTDRLQTYNYTSRLTRQQRMLCKLSCSAPPGTTNRSPARPSALCSLLDSCQSLLALPSSRPLRTTRRPSLPARYSPDIR